MKIIKQWIAGITTGPVGLSLPQYLLVPDKPGGVQKADDVLADDLSEDEREDGQDSREGQGHKDHTVDSQIQDI